MIYNTNIFTLIKKIRDYKSKIITTLKNIKNELRLINAIFKTGKIITHSDQYQKYTRRIFDLNLVKKKFINSIIYLKTAYIMIDRMFSQEILNAELRSKFCFNFFIYDCFPICFIHLFKFCNIPLSCCLPLNYKEDPTHDTLLEEILSFDTKSCHGITDDELHHFNKRYREDTIKYNYTRGLYNTYMHYRNKESNLNNKEPNLNKVDSFPPRNSYMGRTASSVSNV